MMNIDWKEMAKEENLPADFIEEFKHVLDWTTLSHTQEWDESFIETYQEYVNWKHISFSQILSESFIEKYHNKVDWDAISGYQTLSEEFIEKFEKRLSWNRVSKHQKLSEPFLEKHANKIFWNVISGTQRLSERFIEKHEKKLDWARIFALQDLSVPYIMKHLSRLPISCILDQKESNEHTTLTKEDKQYITEKYEAYWKKFISFYNVKEGEFSIHFEEKQFPYINQYFNALKIHYKLQDERILVELYEIFPNKTYTQKRYTEELELSLIQDEAFYHLLKRYISEKENVQNYRLVFM